MTKIEEILDNLFDEYEETSSKKVNTLDALDFIRKTFLKLVTKIDEKKQNTPTQDFIKMDFIHDAIEDMYNKIQIMELLEKQLFTEREDY